MDDLISRQGAIKALAENMPSTYTPDGSHPADEGILMAQEIYVDCIQTLKELPPAQPEPEWIPVSERLPEEYKYVLLCDRELEPDEDTGYSRMAVGWLEDGQICCWDDRAARKEFVAWMPLPKPYKEGEHE